jgi:small subunit ribosomal protein S16
MVKIRLARRGRKKLAMYDLVVANATAPRDGRFIEKIGTYNPNTIPASIVLNDEKALKWLLNGAQPTDTVRAIFSYRGVMYKKHLQVGVLKGALSQEDADAKFDAWKNSKESKITGRVEGLAKVKADAAKARLEAEAKVNVARVAAQAAKQAAEIAAAAPAEEAPSEVVAEEATPSVSEESVPAPVAEVVVEESVPAPVAEVVAEESVPAPVAEVDAEAPAAAEEVAPEVAEVPAPAVEAAEVTVPEAAEEAAPVVEASAETPVSEESAVSSEDEKETPAAG